MYPSTDFVRISKLENLQIVAQRQQELVTQAEQFNTEKESWDCLWENQLQRFHEKVSSLKPLIEKIENNIPQNELNGLKRKLNIEESSVAKKMKLDKENQNC